MVIVFTRYLTENAYKFSEMFLGGVLEVFWKRLGMLEGALKRFIFFLFFEKP